MSGLLSMHKINSSFLIKVLPRACLVFVICLSLIAFTSYTAPKAQAEAITLSLSTAFLMLAIAVMATLGVTLTASTNQDAIDYINDPFLSFLQGKGYSSISDYLASVGITAVTQLCIPVFGAVNIVKSAYDIIAEFCTSFFADNNVVSGGDTVGSSGGNISTEYIDEAYYFDNISFSYPSDDTVTISFGSVSSADDSSYSSPFGILIPSSDVSFPLSVSVLSASSAVLSSDFLGIFVASSYGRPGSYDMVDYTYSISINDTVYISSTAYPYVFIGVCCTDEGDIYSPCDVSLRISQDVVIPGSFTIAPSATVLSPPQVATGQTYSIPSSNTRADDDTDKAINDVVAPLTTTGGLSKTATVAGTAVPAEYEWLYEDTQAIRNNTNPHFDFIPSTLGFDFSIWHYVTEMMSAVSDSFALLGTFISNMPPAVLVFPFGVFALAITVALLRRFLS